MLGLNSFVCRIRRKNGNSGIEDDPNLNTQIKKSLEENGYSVDVAYDGEELFLVILNLMMLLF